MPLHHVASHLQNASRARNAMTSIPLSKMNLAVAIGLYKQGLLSSVQRGDLKGPDEVYTATTPENIATRRIWLGLKYRDARPVLNKCHVVSKPSRRIWMSVMELEELAAGKKGKEMVRGLLPGEVCFISTDQGIMEIQEAISRRIGGQVLIRAS